MSNNLRHNALSYVYRASSLKDKHQKIIMVNKLKAFSPKFITSIPKIVKKSWNDIFTISDNNNTIKVGKNIFPKPQLMGYFLELFIARELIKSVNNKAWKFDPTGYSKDLTNIKNPKSSIEIKSSSSDRGVYGNRSYAEPISNPKKSHDAFYLVINTEKFKNKNKIVTKHPSIKLIRFGYLTHNDWTPQSSNSGQQCYVKMNTAKVKLLELWPILDPVLKKYLE